MNPSMLEQVRKGGISDIHKWTVDNDIEFDVMMCNVYGIEWRWELSFQQQRHHAKNWNFVSLYGLGPGIKKILESSSGLR